MNVKLRELKLKDLKDYLHWNHPDREFHKFNGPYFKQDTLEELKNKIQNYEEKLKRNEANIIENKKIIADAKTDKIIGTVNWYWKSIETLWMEIGIVIFNENYWGKGIGSKALTLWINEKFKEHPNMVRIGLTTWSGNERMIKLAQKLGFKEEARYRKARIIHGNYYDSVSYGILKKDWLSK
jgi:putative hydrolase of HD superfamily